MILHPVLIFLLSWRCIGGEHVENISIESVLDQVAIPTKIINEFLQKPVRGSSSKKRVLQENVESSTIHYENSNGFVPLVPTQPYEFNQNRRDLTRNFSETKNETKSVKTNSLEDEFGYPVEASLFLNLPNPGENRRSFSGNDQDEFELLKVSNGTPAVANYDSFYDNTKDAAKPAYSRSESNFKKSLRNKDRDRGKRIQSYLGTYDAKTENNERYEHNGASKEQKKNFYQQTTSAPQSHYKQDSGRNYRTQKSSLPKTNFASMATPKLNSETHSSNADKGEEHKFNGPIMVQPSEYKVDVKYTAHSAQSLVSTSNPHTDVKAQMDSVSPGSETPEYLPSEGTNRNYESADSRDFSEDYTDYMDEMEKSRRSQKTSRKRPQTFHSSRKLPKEHREVYDDVYDDQGRKRTRSKSRYRAKPKPTPVIEDQYDTEGDNFDENTSNNQQNVNEGNTWNQISPNVEVSHSNGFEINQIEKPKLHIVPVNVLSNFDHATALDNSQGFDITNAMIIHEPLVSTASSLLSPSPNYIDQNLVSSTVKPPLGVSSSVPDIIVGQSSFNNPVQAVLMPNKLQQLNQYIQSTMSPSIFAVTPTPSFSASSSISPSSLQQMLNQASFSINQPFFNAQSNRQSFTNLLQPFQSNANNQVYLNSNGQSYNQFSNAQSTTTTRPMYEKPDSENKKNFNSNNGQFLASASLSVGQGTRPNANNKNSDRKRYHNNNSNNNNNNHNNDYKAQNNDDDDNDYKVQNNQQTRQSANTFLQSTVVPTFLHAGIGLFNNQNHQLVQSPFFITNQQVSKGDAFGNFRKQTQYGVLNNDYQINDFSGIDNVGGASTNVNAINNLISPVQKAQLPILGAKNVEIINPNLNANAYAINQIPTAIVTTPIPIFTTTGFIASKPSYSTTTQEPPVSVQNFVHSLTQIGTNAPNTNKKLNFNSILNIQGPDRPLYNPINFVPNYDLVRSQSILNQNVVQRDPFAQQNLNLVPLVPGGNFFKHSQGAQLDLANKPKLSSDLEKYAEEMFKESLRTMYNTHKWNNDPRPSVSVNLTDNSELAKLRNELLRIRNNLKDSKVPKDVLEGHYTENKIRAVKPGSDYKRPDSSEQSYKQDHKHSGSHHHHHHNHRHKQKINDYLTPPRANSFNSKSPFYDSRPPPKKRPGHGPAHGPRPNFNHDHVRPRPRQGVAPPKSNGIEGQASSVVDYKFPIRSYQERPNYNQPSYRGSDTYNYPTFTTSSPENDYHRSSAEYRSSENNFYDINHQRTHNLMGLLMKNKQLPPGMPENSYYSDTQTVSQFFDEENRRTQTQAYGDALRSFHQKSDRPFRPSLQLNNISQRVNTQPHQAV